MDINLNGKHRGAWFCLYKMDLLPMFLCKDPPRDIKFICRLALKVIQSRQLVKVKAYLVW